MIGLSYLLEYYGGKLKLFANDTFISNVVDAEEKLSIVERGILSSSNYI